MSNTPTFLELNHRLFGFPISTQTTYLQRLRDDEGIFPRGKQGGGAVAPAAVHVANLLIALCAAPSTGRKAPDAIETVRRVRGARRLFEYYIPPDLDFTSRIDGLRIESAVTFGEAIDSLIADMRSGQFVEWLGGDVDISSTIRFFDHGARIFVNLRTRREGQKDSILVFRNDDMMGAPCLTRCTEIELIALQKIAEALGPLAAT